MKIFKYFIIIVAICGIVGIGDSAVDFISSKNDEVPEEAAEGYANEVQSENTDDELTPDEIIAEKGTSVSDWTDRVVFPEQSDITAWNACSTQRSPYMAVWLHVPAGVRFTEYTIDFKSDHFPRGSYYSLATGIWIILLLKSSTGKSVWNMDRTAMPVFRIFRMAKDWESCRSGISIARIIRTTSRRFVLR